jgi:peptidoglycan/LPS O-acetylase OafA/YrhL
MVGRVQAHVDESAFRGRQLTPTAESPPNMLSPDPRFTRLMYRPDLDGLRAVAVLAVIGFHASPRFVPGGFVGVDVFFVISGFLISWIVFDQLANGTFTFADFYARRIRRIFPALAVVLAACWMAGWFLLVQVEYRELLRHLAAGATFLTNFLLWGESGYFDAPSELKPLLHLWSLSVEEQFYLIWPPLLYFCWRRGVNFVTAMAMIIAVSFGLNLALIGTSATAAFYLPHTRLWELLLGGQLAYIERFQSERFALLERRLIFASPDRYDDQLIANLKAGVGLTLILLAIAMLGKNSAFPGWWFSIGALHPLAVMLGLDKGAPYPGWWATLPVVGTALLISAGVNARINRSVLGHPVLVYIGLISYPLYLWHWPLLAFARITESGEPSRGLRLAAVALSFLLAWATYEGLERPTRRTMSRRTPIRIVALAAALAVMAAVSFYASRTNALRSRTPQFVIAVDPPLRSPRHDPACNEHFRTDGEYCQVYAPELPVTTALLGDSHAEHFLNGIGSYLREKHETVVHLGESGCPPLLDVERFANGTSDICRHPNDSVLAYVASRSDLTRVVLSFRGAFDVSGVGFGSVDTNTRIVFKTTGTTLSPADSIRAALTRTVEFLLDHDKTVWLMLQVPELGFKVEECAGRPFSFDHRIRTPCAVPTADVLERQAVYRRIIDEIRDQHPTLRVFDPLQALCDDRWCYAIVNNVLLYVDDNHLSRAGSLFFSKQFTF